MAQLERILGSKNLVANIGYGAETVRNDFSSKYPWNGMQTITDNDGNKWVRIPRYYVHYDVDANGYVTGRRISQYKVGEDWVLNPLFDNNRMYVDLAAFDAYVEVTNDLVLSKEGVRPTTKRSSVIMKTLVDKYDTDDGFDYELWNQWAMQMVQDLMVIEFANANTGEIMKGYGYDKFSNNLELNGTTSSIKADSGAPNQSGNLDGRTTMKYRNLENVVGNGRLYIDGIRLSGDDVIVTRGGEELTSTIKRIKNSGIITKLAYDSTTGLVFPAKVASKGGVYGDYFTGSTSAEQVLITGNNSNEGYGIFSYGCVSDKALGSTGYIKYRMIRLPR